MTDVRSDSTHHARPPQVEAPAVAGPTVQTPAPPAPTSRDQQVSMLFDASPDSIAVLRFADDRFVEVNDRFVEAMGFSRDEIIGQTMADLGIWVDPGADRSRIRSRLETSGVVHAAESPFRRKDGSTLYALVSARLIDYRGEQCVLSVLTDITEHRLRAQELSKLHRVLTVLTSVNQALVRLRDPNAIFHEVCRIIVEDGGCMAWVGLVSPEDARVRPAAWAGASADYIDDIDIMLGDAIRGVGPTAAAITTGRHVLHADIEADDATAPWARNALEHGYRSCASFPLIVGDETAGALSIYSESVGYFDEAQIGLLDELAADISFALDVAEAQASRRRAEERLAASELKYSTAFRTSPDAVNINRLSDGAYVETNDGFAELTGYTREDVAGKSSIDIQIWDDPADRDRLVAGLAAAGVVKNLEARFRRKDGSVTTGLMSARVIEIDGDSCILSVTRDISQRKEAEEEAAAAKAELEQRNRELREALAREQDLARSDALTGVNNRRYWFELAEHEVEVATRYGHPLSVILFDVDRFKLVNDTFGHAVGDEMLECIARAARTELRSADIMGRYGGEEFVVMLPATSAGEARPIAERIRASVGVSCVNTPSERVAVTLSLGIAELRSTSVGSVASGDALDALIDRADAAMYSAKAGGGDRIVTSGR